jgi:flagellar biosynthesis/type III secretory pathway protein FliH
MSSFEKLQPASAVPSTGTDTFGPLGRKTLGSRVPAASVFRDFDGTVAAGGDAGAAPADAAAAPAGAALVDEMHQAVDTAYADGVAAGRTAAVEELVADGGVFVKALDEVKRFRAGLLERYQGELLALALGIARKVVQRELAEHPEHWLGMIREAVRHALDREKIRIRVGPLLHRFLLEHLSTLRPMLEDVKEMELVEDPTLVENGCILESQFGDLDLGVDSQIGAIRAALVQGV